MVSLTTTRNFRQFERLGPVMPPEDKDAALFPIRFDGRFAMIHRPIANLPLMGAYMWISFSPDLKHWGDHYIFIPARRGGRWDANKIGLSPPPIRTDEGCLVLYHGVKNNTDGAIYRFGLALLDLNDPCRVIARADEWVFSLYEEYEVFGDVDKVVSPCGWILDGWKPYGYTIGSADMRLALATANLPKILNWFREHNVLAGGCHT